MMKDRTGIVFKRTAYENRKFTGATSVDSPKKVIHPRKPRILLTKSDRLLALKEKQ
jgi:hypothetical protein